MRPETKELIKKKLRIFDYVKQKHPFSEEGCYIHARDIRSVINCETELLKKQIENLKNGIK